LQKAREGLQKDLAKLLKEKDSILADKQTQINQITQAFEEKIGFWPNEGGPRVFASRLQTANTNPRQAAGETSPTRRQVRPTCEEEKSNWSPTLSNRASIICC
jgi:hypothetical protein